MKQRDAHEVLMKPLNTASMIIARGASAVARRESRSHSMLRSPSHTLSGISSAERWRHVTGCGVTQRRAAAASCLVPGCHPAPEGAQAPSGQGRSAKGGEIGAGWSGTPAVSPVPALQPCKVVWKRSGEHNDKNDNPALASTGQKATGNTLSAGRDRPHLRQLTN